MTQARGGGAIRLPALVALVFFTVSGGAYGTEPIIGGLGPGWGLVVLLVVPLVWSLPISVAVGELAAAMPVSGGYYAWVTRALGPFWGAQEGYWTLAFSAVDLAIYPVLFATYLSYFVPALRLPATGDPSASVLALRWAVAAAVVAAGYAVNAGGAKVVGRAATAFMIVVLAPFVVMTLVGAPHLGDAATAIAKDLSTPKATPVVAVGLAAALWNYGGWDNAATYANEVDDPGRTYPRALLLALLLVVVAYVLPIVAAVGVTTDPDAWGEAGGFPVIARAMGGAWLGAAVAAVAVVSAFGLLCSQLLYVAHLPAAMADDGWLPRKLAVKHDGTPKNALAAVSLVAALASALSFGKLVVLDVLLYGAAMSLELVGLVRLRRTEPDLPRPFRVPFGAVGLTATVVLPLSCVAMVAWVSAREKGGLVQLAIVGAVVVVSLVAAKVRRR